MFRDARRGIGRDIGQPGRVVAFGDNDHRIIHRASFTEVCDNLGHGGRTLADRAIYAEHIFPALVQDGVDRDCRLAGPTVAQDQLPLAASNGDKCIDDLQPGLQGHGDGRSVHNGGRRAFDWQSLVGCHRAFVIERSAQRIDHPSQQAIAHSNVHNPARALDFIPCVQMRVFAEQHHADFARVYVERDAEHISGKLEQLVETRIGQARNPCDAR